MKKRIVSIVLALAMATSLLGTAGAATHTVVRGDNLSKLAQIYLGDATRWNEIYQANRNILSDPNHIYVGQQLAIPDGSGSQPSGNDPTPPADTPTPPASQEPEAPGTEAPGGYTLEKVYNAALSFGSVKVTAYTNDSKSTFSLTFEGFGDEQVLEGTVANGTVNVTFDKSGFFTGDAQTIWDAAQASDVPWAPIGTYTAGAEDPAGDELNDFVPKSLVSEGYAPSVTTPASGRVDKNEQTRIIITTDAEVDDFNSLLLLLLYADEVDIDGLVYSASFVHFNGDGNGTTQGEVNPDSMCESGVNFGIDPLTLTEFRPMDLDWIQDVIDTDYRADYQYLSQNSPNYPTPEELLNVIYIGNVEFEGDVRFDTEGSNYIKQCILDDDQRTLYISQFGGVNTVVRALMSIAEEYQNTDQWAEIQQKVIDKVVIRGTGQDRSWTINNIDELYPGLRTAGGSGPAFGYFGTYQGPIQVRDHFTAEWLTENIKFNHGKLMEHVYLMGDGQTLVGEPDIYQYGWVTYIDWAADLNLVGFPRFEFNQYDWLAFTDTPGFVWLIPTGLRGLENGNLGSWGGRISIDGEPQNRKGTYEEYNPYTGKMDSGFGSSRFLEDFFDDWAARAEWAVNTYENANHAPVVSAVALDINAEPGQTVDIKGIYSDPDGDDMNIKWWVYQEASEYYGKNTNLAVWDDRAAATKFTVPTDAENGDYFTLVFEVQDVAGKPMTRYAEVLVHVAVDERENPFTNITKNDPYYEAVLNAYYAGVLEVGDGTFNANGTISYQEAVNIVNALADNQVAVNEAFGADAEIIRGEVAVLVEQALGLTYMFGSRSFNDVPEGSEYYLPCVHVSARHFISPDANGNFRPYDAITRAEFYSIISAAFFEEGWV